MELPSTIAEPVTHEIVIKRSRFITHLAPVSTVDQAQDVIAAVGRQHWTANHNCVAMALGTRAEIRRSSDDGEPSGTAGVPMMEVLLHRKVTDLVAVVTRYFGGVMLGAGGLIRAYGSAVSQALDLAPLIHRRLMTSVTLDVDHAQAGRIDHWLRDWASSQQAVMATTTYGPRLATFSLLVPPQALSLLQADVAAVSSGSVTALCGSQQVADVPA